MFLWTHSCSWPRQAIFDIRWRINTYYNYIIFEKIKSNAPPTIYTVINMPRCRISTSIWEKAVFFIKRAMIRLIGIFFTSLAETWWLTTIIDNLAATSNRMLGLRVACTSREARKWQSRWRWWWCRPCRPLVHCNNVCWFTITQFNSFTMLNLYKINCIIYALHIITPINTAWYPEEKGRLHQWRDFLKCIHVFVALFVARPKVDDGIP